MDYENSNKAGPSGLKRRKIDVKDPKNLTVDEMLEFLYVSGSESEDGGQDSDEFAPSDSDEDDPCMYYFYCIQSIFVMSVLLVEFSVVEDAAEIETAVATWKDEACGMKKFPFTKKNQMLVELPESGEPYDYFRLLLDDKFLEDIITETNRYAQEILCSSGISVRSRISEWKDLTKYELLRFIGLTFHMGTIKLNRMQDYWKKHRLFNLTCFSNYMGRDRYLIIMRCLHFSKNPEEGEPLPQDRLYKIRPVLKYFNDKMLELYFPGKNLSLDESMLLWRGRLVFKQYIKNKRHKYGLKLYMLTEPNGLVLNFAVYTGQLDEMGGRGHSQKVVLHLARENLNSGHSLYMDNYYNSYDLAKTLLEKKTYCTGTLRRDRKEVPKDVLGAKLKKGKVDYFHSHLFNVFIFYCF